MIKNNSLSGERNFYEGRFIRSWRFHRRGLKGTLFSMYESFSIGHYERRFFERCFRKIGQSGLRILDLGSGGGDELLLQWGSVTAADLSYSSLLKTTKLGYASCVVADARRLPFAENAFDLVTSSHFLGHIPVRDKDEVVKEIFRVTKPGGFSMHSVECDSKAWFYRKAKESPTLYQKYFIEMYGHFGLELQEANFERFRRLGFDVCHEEADPHKGYLRPVESYATFFDNEYKGKSQILGTLAFVSRILSSTKLLRAVVNFLLGMLVPPISLLTPPDHRDSLKCLYRKPVKEIYQGVIAIGHQRTD